MNKKLHNPPDDIRHIYKWYKKSQVDYTQLYIHLYIAYNAWYRQVTGTMNDREAISSLKKRFVIWDDYCKGRTLNTLGLYMDKLSVLMKAEPLMSSSVWNGSVEDRYDWRGLIEFWYQVRCLIVHGSEVPPKYVWLAYETLDLFMAEIIGRMQACFTDKDLVRLDELTTLSQLDPTENSRFKRLQQKLQAKYIESPNIWQVDMQRMSKA